MACSQGAMALCIFVDKEAKQGFLNIDIDETHRRRIADLEKLVGQEYTQRLRAEHCAIQTERRAVEIAEEAHEQMEEAFERNDIIEGCMKEKGEEIRKLKEEIAIFKKLRS